MYVCVCNAVTDKQIKSAIKQGICTRTQLRKCLGVGNNCGQCNQQVSKMLDAYSPGTPIIYSAIHAQS